MKSLATHIRVCSQEGFTRSDDVAAGRLCIVPPAPAGEERYAAFERRVHRARRRDRAAELIGWAAAVAVWSIGVAVAWVVTR